MAKKSDLKKFRHEVAILKKRGLIANVDARSVVPTPALKKSLKKFAPVLRGEASAVKLSAKGLKEYQAMGKPFKIARPKGLPQRVMIRKEVNEKVTVSHGKVRVSNPAGVTRTILPVRFENLEQYLEGLRKQKFSLKKGEQLAFRFFDNKSLQTFPSINALINYLSHYESVFDAIEDDNAEAQSEIYQNLEIVKVEQKEEWKKRAPKYSGWNPRESEYGKRKRKLKSAPAWKKQQYLDRQAQRAREYRARLKGVEKEKYKAKARKRAKKSAKKR